MATKGWFRYPGMEPKKRRRKHPSGPGLPGHPTCPPGQIYDHSLGKCIPMTKKK